MRLRDLGRRSREAVEGFAATFGFVCKWRDDLSSKSNKGGLRHGFRHEIRGAERHSIATPYGGRALLLV